MRTRPHVGADFSLTAPVLSCTMFLHVAGIFAGALVLCAARTVPISSETLNTRACLPPHDTFPFCDATLPTAARVADLVGRLEGAEIPPQLTARHRGGGSPGPESNVSRIGLPTFGASPVVHIPLIFFYAGFIIIYHSSLSITQIGG